MNVRRMLPNQQQAPLWRPSLYRGNLPCSSSKLHKGDPHCTGVFVHPTVWVWVCCWGWGWDCCWRVRYLTLVYCFTFCGRLEMTMLSSSSVVCHGTSLATYNDTYLLQIGIFYLYLPARCAYKVATCRSRLSASIPLISPRSSRCQSLLSTGSCL